MARNYHLSLLFFIFFFSMILVGKNSKLIQSMPPHKIKTTPKTTTVIKVGATLPLSGGLKHIGKDIYSGISMVFNEANQHKKIAQHLLNFIALDDRYREEISTSNITQLLSQTSILFSPYGVDTLENMSQKEIANTLFLFPSLSTKKFRSNKYPSLIFYSPPLQEELKILIDYTIEILKAEKIAFLYEENSWGKEGINFAKQYIKKLNKDDCSIVACTSYPKNTVLVEKAAKYIINKTPDAIICIAHNRSTYAFIREMINNSCTTKHFLATAESSLIYNDLKKSRDVSLITTSPVPNPWTSKILAAQKYRHEIHQYLSAYPLSPFSFEAVIKAKLFVECLKKISPPFTKQKIAQSITQFKNFQGLEFEWDATTRTLSPFIWLIQGPHTIKKVKVTNDEIIT